MGRLIRLVHMLAAGLVLSPVIAGQLPTNAGHTWPEQIDRKAAAAVPLPASSEPTNRSMLSAMSYPVPLFDTLSREAEVADTPKGAEAYSKHLIKLIVDNDMGDDFVSAQASRLATVDLLARRGEREYVDERSVADAFNELMKKVRGLSGRVFTTDSATVHRLRLGISRNSPVLTTVSVHASACLPSEALLLIALLVTNNGAISEPSSSGITPAPRVTTGRRVPGDSVASVVLVNFLGSHSRSEDARLFDILKKYIGF